ncbi:hypothetical protein CALCODRAFT_513665 [Calocera cornea HHB12733]|uniref:Uncharacterized protein n=1 Tax=Calocera cornea HHB12733 TaxID=1353952 RepID=A0A166JF06_9BASI|nr:hypothetical protein CALCODRAFT_513665 [Calocera cornea HHB12733]
MTTSQAGPVRSLTKQRAHTRGRTRGKESQEHSPPTMSVQAGTMCAPVGGLACWLIGFGHLSTGAYITDTIFKLLPVLHGLKEVQIQVHQSKVLIVIGHLPSERLDDQDPSLEVGSVRVLSIGSEVVYRIPPVVPATEVTVEYLLSPQKEELGTSSAIDELSREPTTGGDKVPMTVPICIGAVSGPHPIS